MHGLCFLQAASFHVTALLIFVVALGRLRGLAIGVVALGLPLTLWMWHEQWEGASGLVNSCVEQRKCHSTCSGV